jgi:hypothetical protein
MRAMNRSLTTSAAFALSLLVASTASADTRSWTAVKKVIGKGDAIVVGIDLARLRTTGAYQQGLQLFLAAEDEARTVLDTVKADCGFDVTTVLSDLTVVMRPDGNDPLIAFGLDGIDEAKAVACIGLVAGKMVDKPGVKLVGKRIGKITEYSIKGERDRLYAAWLAKDVLVFTEDVNDRKRLERRIAGKGATGDLAKFIGRTSPASPFWFAVAMREREDGRTIIGGHGRLDVAAGTFKGAGAIVMSKPQEATDMAAEGAAGLAEAKKEMAPKVPELARILGTLAITAVGDEVRITGSASDKDIGALIPQLGNLF